MFRKNYSWGRKRFESVLISRVSSEKVSTVISVIMTGVIIAAVHDAVWPRPILRAESEYGGNNGEDSVWAVLSGWTGVGGNLPLCPPPHRGSPHSGRRQSTHAGRSPRSPLVDPGDCSSHTPPHVLCVG